MAISNSVIKKFASTTSHKKERNSESHMYGVAFVENDKPYVVLDGSAIKTPVTTTVDVKTGDRVIVMIKNHTAIITGNLTGIVSSDISKEAFYSLPELYPELSDYLLGVGVSKYRLSLTDLQELIGGTMNYNELNNRPSIEGVTLEGNKTFEELNLENISNSQLEEILIL